MPDRPVECSHCKKTISVDYKEITEDSTVHTEMCADCPVLERKLHGSKTDIPTIDGWKETTGLACGNCGTNLEGVKMGNPLGCSECYNVFSDILIADLLETGKIPPRLKERFKQRIHLPFHMGKSPTELEGAFPSEQLTTLNESLKDALKKENYEQAAWLRDQIKVFIEKKENGNK